MRSSPIDPEWKKAIDEIPLELFYQVRGHEDEKREQEIKKQVEREAQLLADQQIKHLINTLEEIKVEAVRKYYKEKPFLEEKARTEEAARLDKEFQQRERERVLKESEELEKKKQEELKQQKEKELSEYKNAVDTVHSLIAELTRNLLDNPPSTLLDNSEIYDPKNDHPITAQIIQQFESSGSLENSKLKQEQEDETLINTRFVEQRRREMMTLETPRQPPSKNETISTLSVKKLGEILYDKGFKELDNYLERSLKDKQEIEASIDNDIRNKELKFLLELLYDRNGKRHSKLNHSMRAQLTNNSEPWIDFFTKNFDLQKHEDALLKQARPLPRNPLFTQTEGDSTKQRRQYQLKHPLFEREDSKL
ncbi:hypothetical protein FDP41_013640 [Naegleria fowleri]|uniref:Uncharacterized protein n=1 Tax=Naegleria fowleri TaxID=5763 RepID=A0A6A5BYG8_NAEFO|nr:uncharacterized protein FDP41_013640 [Naegleria fowleri]KAF0980426.1 hypothetical protein FDP41_013640 [Naegleria fowleri]